MTKHLLYLEPYTFLKRNQESAIIVNTLSGKCFEVETSANLNHLIDKIQGNDLSYSTLLEKCDLEKEEYKKLISTLRETYSGDLVEVPEHEPLPVILSPKINNRLDVARLRTNKDRSIGDEVMDYIHEVKVVLTAKCNNGCAKCKNHYKQFDACSTAFLNNREVQIAHIKRFFNQFNPEKVPSITLMGGDLTLYPELMEALMFFSSLNTRKTILVNHNHIGRLQEFIGNDLLERFTLRINITPNASTSTLLEHLPKLLASSEVSLVFIVESEEDCNNATNLINQLGVKDYSFKPYYNGANLEFFRNEVFLSIEDITSETYSKNDIFLRQSLNSYDFGKLTILPSGDIIANSNFGIIGTIETPLGKVYANEVNNGNSWFRTRTKQPCNSCIYQWLCPSPSNYELVIGKPNLCHIYTSLEKK